MNNRKIETTIWAFPQRSLFHSLVGVGLSVPIFFGQKKSKKGFPLLSLTQNLSFTSTADKLIVNQ